MSDRRALAKRITLFGKNMKILLTPTWTLL